MVLQLQAVSVLLALLISSAVADAKSCTCAQHPATATASGSCTLSESGTYCSILFNPAYHDAEAEKARTEFNMKRVELEKFGTFETVDPLLTFERLYLNKQDVTAAELTTAAMTAVPLEHVAEVAVPFARLFGTKSARLPELVETFNRLQCVEAEDEGFRVLIISVNSQLNSSCTP